MKSSVNQQDVDKILSRLKEAYGLTKDAEVASLLGISSGRLANWKTRRQIPISVLLTKCEDINSDWLLFGRGEPRPVNEGPKERANTSLPGLGKSAAELETVFGKLSVSERISLLMLLGYPQEQAMELVSMKNQDEIARLAMDLLWIKLGFPVRRTP